jgi:hypothetical protein
MRQPSFEASAGLDRYDQSAGVVVDAIACAARGYAVHSVLY